MRKGRGRQHWREAGKVVLGGGGEEGKWRERKGEVGERKGRGGSRPTQRNERSLVAMIMMLLTGEFYGLL